MAEIYNTDRFAELYYPSNTADLLQLGLAARFVAMLFESHRVTYAFIGGWAVYLRGGRRRTQDIDITVATTMDHLKQILMAQSRYYLPYFCVCAMALSFLILRTYSVPRFSRVLFYHLGPLLTRARIHYPAVHGRTSVQIFIDTGRSVDDEFPHVPDLAVSMDIVISGKSQFVISHCDGLE